MTPAATITAPTPSAAAVWAPWLAAPLFALLPIGGCGLAGGIRPAVARRPAVAASAPVPDAPVVTILPADDRLVAWRPAAN